MKRQNSNHGFRQRSAQMRQLIDSFSLAAAGPDLFFYFFFSGVKDAEQQATEGRCFFFRAVCC